MPDKKQIAFEIIQDFFVSASLTVAALCISKAEITWMTFLTETVFAWIVNMIIGFLVPEKRIGEKLAKKLHMNKVLSFLFTMFVIVLINVTGISIFVVLKNVGFNIRFFSVWCGLFPFLLGVGYVVALIWIPVTNFIVNSMFGKETE